VQATPLNPRDPKRMEELGLDRKQALQRAALMRMCSRHLGFKPFPSPNASGDGWMWRSRPDLARII